MEYAHANLDLFKIDAAFATELGLGAAQTASRYLGYFATLKYCIFVIHD